MSTYGTQGPALDDVHIDGTTQGLVFEREDGYVAPPTPSINSAVLANARARALALNWFLE